MHIITMAGAHVGDVGKKVGFDMSEGWGMVIASIATGVFVIGAAVLAYLAGRRQVKDQALADHRAWRRQNRFDAYQKLLVASDAFGEEMDRWLKLSTRDIAALGRAMNVVSSAEAGVRLAGPESMHGPAKAVFVAAGEVYARCRRPAGQMVSQIVPGIPIPPRVWVDLSRKLLDAQKAFVEAAAGVVSDGEA